MSNNLTTYDAEDGWNDAASDHATKLIRGDLLKCNKGHWLLGQEAKPLPAGTRLVATGTNAAWVKWGTGDNGLPRPVEYRVRKPGEAMPEREELGDLNEADWPAGPDGQPRDPWQNTRFLYLVNPETAATCTFSTATYGGRGAVSALGSQIVTMRTARRGVSPVVELHSAPYKTKYGIQMKPVFKVVGWVGGNTETVTQTAPTPKLIAPANDRAASTVYGPIDNDMTDEVPF
jgi:hypothetical protein